MQEQHPEAVIKQAEEITYERLSKADGVEKGVIFDESDGAPNFRMRHYRLAPGAEVPKHTNGVEHEIHTVSGEYVVGIDGEEYTVSPGDSLLIPAGTVHWFRNETDEESAFICMVPTGDAGIELVEE